MDTLFENIFGAILNGGPTAIIAVLVIVILALWFERKRLLGEVERKEEKIDKIIDDYAKGNVTLSEALNSLKFVLAEIKGKIK
jgi:hypothetical protein